MRTIDIYELFDDFAVAHSGDSYRDQLLAVRADLENQSRRARATYDTDDDRLPLTAHGQPITAARALREIDARLNR